MRRESHTDLFQREADYWDRRCIARSQRGRIPMEADIRRATRVVPTHPGEKSVDPDMHEILEGCERSRFIDWVAHAEGGRVLDVGCGSGWLALELGRRRQIVDAFDLSPQAIALAKRMLAENPYREGFGAVNYYVQDVTSLDLGRERYDAVSAWSALHHLPNLEEFMDCVWAALKPGGILATLDDFPQGRLERVLQRVLSLALPSYHKDLRAEIHSCVAPPAYPISIDAIRCYKSDFSPGGLKYTGNCAVVV